MASITHLTQEKIDQIMKLYKDKGCNITLTCEALTISRQLWYDWKKNSPEFKKAIEDTEASLIDHAESQLFKNIQNGKEVSLIFFLKNKAPDRWHDRKEVDLTGSMKMIALDCEAEDK